MSTPEDRILAYPHLDEGEKRAVEGYVESNPEWTSLLRDVKALEAYANRVRLFDAESPTDEVLATYAVAQYLHPDRVPAPLADAFDRVKTRLANDPDYRARYEAMLQRMKAVEDETDPLDRFEAITGHRLDPAPPPHRSDDAASDAFDGVGAAAHGALPTDGVPAGDSPPAFAADRDASPSSHRLVNRLAPFSSVARRVALAFVLVLGLYGVLYGVSWSTQSPADRLAAMDVNEEVIATFQDTRTRGATSVDTVTADAIYLRALPLLRDARTSTVGLFPHYDHNKLNEAERLLRDVVASTSAGAFLQLEARFYLGKVNLAQRDLDAARSHFKEVVRHEGRRATEAYRILREIEREYPAGNRSPATSRVSAHR